MQHAEPMRPALPHLKLATAEIMPLLEGTPAASVALTVDGRSASTPESVELLDGGGQA